jgi:hypothetical protein
LGVPPHVLAPRVLSAEQLALQRLRSEGQMLLPTAKRLIFVLITLFSQGGAGGG